MNNNHQIIIRLTEIYQRSISSRASISILVDKYKIMADVTLLFDFNQIAFISRSAAQQLTLEKRKLEKNKINFVYTNIDLQVNQMLELAEHKLIRVLPNINYKSFSSQNEMNDFLINF